MVREGSSKACLVFVALFLAHSCSQQAVPEDMALEYGRALYSTDPAKIYRLLSDEDRQVKDERTFRREQRRLEGFTREILGQLATFITAAPVGKKIDGRRATVTMKFRLPDANAAPISTLARDWNEDRLNALSRAERAQIRERLEQLHRSRELPMIEGDETIDLVRDAEGWRVRVHWADGVRLRFGATVDPGVPLEITVSPEGTVAAPGEPLRVTVRAKNVGPRDVTARVGHDVGPKPQSDFLTFLQCPLFLPVRLKPGETQEFVSEYLILKDIPRDAKQLTATYRFRIPSMEIPTR